MIQLTRLNGRPLAVNADLIKFVEASPDTVLTLVTGEKLVVKEDVPEVLRLAFEYRRQVSQPIETTLPSAGNCDDSKT